MTTSKQKAKCGTQMTYDSSTGNNTYLAFSSDLAHDAAIVIFDNSSDSDVTISDDGTNDWKTFSAGTALVLDMRTNRSDPAGDYAFPKGTQFYASSAAGTGNFYISYMYTR